MSKVNLKNKTTMYAVVRTEEFYYNQGHDGNLVRWVNPHVIGLFSTLEEADNYRDACAQEMDDKLGHHNKFLFETQSTIYYT